MTDYTPLVEPAPPELRVVTATAAVPSDFGYNIARQIELLPQWASGLATGVFQLDGAWFADSPMGRVRIEMTPENRFGVLDHVVTLPDGNTVHNAFRVAPAGAHHCVFTFVVVRQPDSTIETFKSDVAHVEKDLGALKALLERETHSIDRAKRAIAGLEDLIAGSVGTPEDLDALLSDRPTPP